MRHRSEFAQDLLELGRQNRRISCMGKTGATIPLTRLQQFSTEVKLLCLNKKVGYQELWSFWASLKNSLGYLHRRAGKTAQLKLYTDGSVKDGVGAWAFVAVDEWDRVAYEKSGTEREVEATRMEIHAALQALKSLKSKTKVQIFSDSRILIDAMTVDLKTWQKNQWMKPNGKPNAYKELMLQLCAFKEKHDIAWYWVKAHAGNAYNERCDKLCRLARTKTT